MYQSHDNLSLDFWKSESTAYFSISEAHHLMTVSRSHYLPLRNKIISNFLQRGKLQVQKFKTTFIGSGSPQASKNPDSPSLVTTFHVPSMSGHLLGRKTF